VVEESRFDGVDVRTACSSGGQAEPFRIVGCCMRRILGRREWLLASSGLVAAASSCSVGTDRLVVYCAHDSQLACPVLERFAGLHGVEVLARYDTEANKSLGLVNRLRTERERPQCDVFWNNELLGTALLGSEGVLMPLSSERSDRLPGSPFPKRRSWVVFGGRLRLVISPRPVDLSESAVMAALERGDLSDVTIAKPMFGTTLTQYCAWGESWGLEELKRRHQSWLRKGIRYVGGNSATKDLVAAGVCSLGFTDSDDFFVAVDAGRSLHAVPVRVSGKTICIPNSAAVIQGSRQPDLARRLVEYLCSPEVELELARSPARQIPLGAVDPQSLPEEVRALRRWADESLELEPLLSMRGRVLEWLRQDYMT